MRKNKTKARDFVFKNKFVRVEKHALVGTNYLRAKERKQCLIFVYFQWRRERNVRIKKKKTKPQSPHSIHPKAIFKNTN